MPSERRASKMHGSALRPNVANVARDRRVTMADVAEAGGVHVTTVSLAIRNHPRIPRATRDRLQQLARKMGYRPDPEIQSLVAYRTRMALRQNPPTIAYVTNWDTRFGWKNVTAHPQFFAGAQSRAFQLGFKVEHFWLGEQFLRPQRLSRILRARSIHGLIIASHIPDLAPTSPFEWEFFSAVKIDYLPSCPALHNVTNDHMGIVRTAVRRALAAGYKRIGFIMHRDWNDCANRLWSAAFLGEQSVLPAAARIPIMMFPDQERDKGSAPRRDFNPIAPTAAFRRWFDQHQPDIILSKQSFVRPCLAELGLRVPGDVAFLDLFLDDVSGATAGVRQNYELVGETAAEILIGLVCHSKMGEPNVARTTLIGGTWFDGQSCPVRSPSLAPTTQSYI
jgi:LacI family transcriptional regulator